MRALSASWLVGRVESQGLFVGVSEEHREAEIGAGELPTGKHKTSADFMDQTVLNRLARVVGKSQTRGVSFLIDTTALVKPFPEPYLSVLL